MNVESFFFSSSEVTCDLMTTPSRHDFEQKMLEGINGLVYISRFAPIFFTFRYIDSYNLQTNLKTKDISFSNIKYCANTKSNFYKF